MSVAIRSTLAHTRTQGITAHIKPRKPLIAEGRDGIAEQRDGNKDEEDLVCFAFEDTNARLLLKHIDARGEEEGCAVVDSQSDADVADDEKPAADPASNAPPPGW